MNQESIKPELHKPAWVESFDLSHRWRFGRRAMGAGGAGQPCPALHLPARPEDVQLARLEARVEQQDDGDLHRRRDGGRAMAHAHRAANESAIARRHAQRGYDHRQHRRFSLSTSAIASIPAHFFQQLDADGCCCVATPISASIFCRRASSMAVSPATHPPSNCWPRWGSRWPAPGSISRSHATRRSRNCRRDGWRLCTRVRAPICAGLPPPTTRRPALWLVRGLTRSASPSGTL